MITILVIYEKGELKLRAYHSNGETSEQLTYIYWPLEYLNPCGLDTCSARTFPGYTATWNILLKFHLATHLISKQRWSEVVENICTLRILTDLLPDLNARSSLSHPYSIMGTARYIHVCRVTN